MLNNGQHRSKYTEYKQTNRHIYRTCSFQQSFTIMHVIWHFSITNQHKCSQTTTGWRWWWWFHWSFAHHVATVVTTTSVTPIKCRMETFWYLLSADPGLPGKMAVETGRESTWLCGLPWVWVIIHCMCWLITCEIWFCRRFSWEWLIDQSPSD